MRYFIKSLHLLTCCRLFPPCVECLRGPQCRTILICCEMSDILWFFLSEFLFVTLLLPNNGEFKLFCTPLVQSVYRKEPVKTINCCTSHCREDQWGTRVNVIHISNVQTLQCFHFVSIVLRCSQQYLSHIIWSQL